MEFEKGNKVIITKGKDMICEGIGGIVPVTTSQLNAQIFGCCHYETCSFDGDVLEGIIRIVGAHNYYLIESKDSKYHVFCNNYNEMELKKGW